MSLPPRHLLWNRGHYARSQVGGSMGKRSWVQGKQHSFLAGWLSFFFLFFFHERERDSKKSLAPPRKRSSTCAMENTLMLGNNRGRWGELATASSIKREQLQPRRSQRRLHGSEGQRWQVSRCASGETKSLGFYYHQPIFKPWLKFVMESLYRPNKRPQLCTSCSKMFFFNTHTYIYICMHVYICVYTYMYIYMNYTHICTYIYSCGDKEETPIQDGCI